MLIAEQKLFSIIILRVFKRNNFRLYKTIKKFFFIKVIMKIRY